MFKGSKMKILQKISHSLLEGAFDKTEQLTIQALDENLQPQDILNQGLISGMGVVGDLFRNHEIFLPDVLLAAAKAYNEDVDKRLDKRRKQAMKK